MFYEMLTGAVPFQGDNAMAVMHQHLTATVTPIPSELAIPANVESIIRKTIRKDPKERYQSAETFLADLTHYKELDLAQFPREENNATGLVTNRQIWILGVVIALGFLAVIGLIIIFAMMKKG
jgi:serine/threonine protein kinase